MSRYQIRHRDSGSFQADFSSMRATSLRQCSRRSVRDQSGHVDVLRRDRRLQLERSVHHFEGCLDSRRIDDTERLALHPRQLGHRFRFSLGDAGSTCG